MNEVVMYSTPICPYCYQAKKLLHAKGADVMEINVMMDPEKRAEMIERSGRRTVPQIFIDGHHVGGYDELTSLDESGRLDPMLRGAA